MALWPLIQEKTKCPQLVKNFLWSRCSSSSFWMPPQGLSLHLCGVVVVVGGLLNTNKHTDQNKPSKKGSLPVWPAHEITSLSFQLHTNLIEVFHCLNLCSSPSLACSHLHCHGYQAVGDWVLPPPSPGLPSAAPAQPLSISQMRPAQLCRLPASVPLCSWLPVPRLPLP